MSLLTAKFLAFNTLRSYGDPVASAYFAELAEQLTFASDYADAYAMVASDLL